MLFALHNKRADLFLSIFMVESEHTVVAQSYGIVTDFQVTSEFYCKIWYYGREGDNKVCYYSLVLIPNSKRKPFPAAI